MAETFAHPREEHNVHDRSNLASRMGSGLCKASSRSGSLVSHRYGGTVVVVMRGRAGAAVSSDPSEEGVLLLLKRCWRPVLGLLCGLYYEKD